VYARAMAGGGAMAGMLVASNLKRLMSGIDSAREAWRALEARGLTLGTEEVSGLASASGKQRPYLHGTVAGVTVEVHIRSDSVHYPRTEVVATPLAGADATIGVHLSPGGVLGYLRSWIGQDIEIGDEAFDAAYLIAGKPEEAAKALLVPSVRELIASLGGSLAAFKYEADKVSVVLHGVEVDATNLGVAIDLAAAGATFKG
jgi:hypothetical protein